MNPRQHGPDLDVFDQVRAECQAMAQYAFASGLKVPASVLHVLTSADVDASDPAARAEAATRLVPAHDQLARVVAPATPRTLLLLSRERRGARLGFLGPVRLVRQMMLVAIVLLLTFILTALSPDVTHSSGDIFDSSGFPLLINELFLLSAAGVGAAFTALFRANRYIANGTYDPKYESSYWVRFILGLIAGIVLPALIPVEGGPGFTRPLLALLGGFSASVVYRILSRLVDTLESFVQGDSRDLLAAREQVLKVQAAEQRVQDQLRLGAALIKLRSELEAGTGSEQVKATVTRIIDDLVPRDARPEPADEPQPVEPERPRPVVVS